MVLDQPKIPLLIFFFILITCLIDMVLILWGEILYGHSWKYRVNLHSLFCIENSYLAVLTGVVKWLIRPDDSTILTRSNRFSQNTACLFLDLLPCIEQQVTEDKNSSISRGLINNIYNINFSLITTTTFPIFPSASNFPEHIKFPFLLLLTDRKPCTTLLNNVVPVRYFLKFWITPLLVEKIEEIEALTSSHTEATLCYWLVTCIIAIWLVKIDEELFLITCTRSISSLLQSPIRWHANSSSTKE